MAGSQRERRERWGGGWGGALGGGGWRESSVSNCIIVELLGPNFQQKFAFGGRSMKFGVEILLTMLYLKTDRSKSF